MSVVPFVDLVAQYRTIKPAIDAAIHEVVEKQNFILGKQVDDFEKAFAAFVGSSHGVGMSSGLDALRLALAAVDVGPGHEVVLPANTFIATALAVTAVGAKPVLVDCDEHYNIDTTAIEAAMTDRTRALLPVHLTGQAADLDPILAIAKKRGVRVIEDAAQAHGTLYKGRPCGSIGDLGCFSFYPGKNLGAYGDGGLVTTGDDALDARLRRLRNYGQRVKYEHVEAGTNARLDTIQAAILGVKLGHLASWNAARARHAAEYAARLEGVGDLRVQPRSPHSTHIYHLFIVETARRDGLQKHLEERGVSTVIHYPTPIHLQPVFAELGLRAGAFPRTERLAKRMLSLPMFPELTSQQIETVTTAVRSYFDG